MQRGCCKSGGQEEFDSLQREIRYIIFSCHIARLADLTMLEGDIFAQRVQLGGTLYASEESKAVTGQSKESKSKAMKASAAASFSSAWAQASVSASHSQGGSSAENKTEQDLTNSMAWEATGGDTLLCNKYAI